ncbi:MAG: YmfQ family protein [Eubacterium sp.]|jgi:hypothetical protein|nr:YmfQ family protein [Eubacterium sp.]
MANYIDRTLIAEPPDAVKETTEYIALTGGELPVSKHSDRLLIDYFPNIIKDVREFKALMHAEQPEITGGEKVNGLFNEIELVLANQFVQTASIYGVRRWEKLIGIIPSSDDIIERKRIILARLREQLPYTYNKLEILLSNILGSGNFKINLYSEKYTLIITLTDFSNYKIGNVGALLVRVCPANLVLGLGNKDPLIFININGASLMFKLLAPIKEYTAFKGNHLDGSILLDGSWIFYVFQKFIEAISLNVDTFQLRNYGVQETWILLEVSLLNGKVKLDGSFLLSLGGQSPWNGMLLDGKAALNGLFSLLCERSYLSGTNEETGHIIFCKIIKIFSGIEGYLLNIQSIFHNYGFYGGDKFLDGKAQIDGLFRLEAGYEVLSGMKGPFLSLDVKMKNINAFYNRQIVFRFIDGLLNLGMHGNGKILNSSALLDGTYTLKTNLSFPGVKMSALNIAGEFHNYGLQGGCVFMDGTVNMDGSITFAVRESAIFSGMKEQPLKIIGKIKNINTILQFKCKYLASIRNYILSLRLGFSLLTTVKNEKPFPIKLRIGIITSVKNDYALSGHMRVIMSMRFKNVNNISEYQGYDVVVKFKNINTLSQTKFGTLAVRKNLSLALGRTDFSMSISSKNTEQLGYKQIVVAGSMARFETTLSGNISMDSRFLFDGSHKLDGSMILNYKFVKENL